MAIVQFTRFKSRQARGNGQYRKAGEDNLRKTWRRISSAVPVPHRRVGRRVARFHALLQLGGVWKGAGGSGEGPRIREAVGTYSYLCRIDGPQHRRRRRSLTTPCRLPQPPTERVAGRGARSRLTSGCIRTKIGKCALKAPRPYREAPPATQ